MIILNCLFQVALILIFGLPLLVGGALLWRRICVYAKVSWHAFFNRGHKQIITVERGAYQWPEVKCATCGHTLLD